MVSVQDAYQWIRRDYGHLGKKLNPHFSMRESFLGLSCAGYAPRNLVDECVKKTHGRPRATTSASCGVSGPII